MNTTESTQRITHGPSGIVQIIETIIYEGEGSSRKIVKTVVVRMDIANDYVQTHIYDCWGYKIMWFDNHGSFQHFDRVVFTEETAKKSGDIGKMDDDSWSISDTVKNTFKGKLYADKEFKQLRVNHFREPYPKHIKDIIPTIYNKEIKVKVKESGND